MVCSDGLNTDEQGLRFAIKIMAVNDEVPKIYINDFVVEEGKLLQIDLPILNVIDRDLPPDLLVFKVNLRLDVYVCEHHSQHFVL